MALEIENIRDNFKAFGDWLDDAMGAAVPDYQRTPDPQECVDRGCLIRSYVGSMALRMQTGIHDRLAKGQEVCIEDGLTVSVVAHYGHKEETALAKLGRKTIHLTHGRDESGEVARQMATRTRTLAIDWQPSLVASIVDVAYIKSEPQPEQHAGAEQEDAEEAKVGFESSRPRASLSTVEQAINDMRLEVSQALEAASAFRS
jgi:hypothetical protein